MKLQKTAAKLMASLSLKLAKEASGSASFAGYHQPKEPKALKRLKKS